MIRKGGYAVAENGKGRTGSVQSIERAFGLLETMADAGGMMGLSQLATASGWRWRPVSRNGNGGSSQLGRFVAWLRAPTRLPRWALLFIAAAVAVYLFSVGVENPQPSSDVRIMAAIVAVVTAGLMAMRWREADSGWMLKGAAFLALVMAVYFDRQTMTFLDRRATLQVVCLQRW